MSDNVKKIGYREITKQKEFMKSVIAAMINRFGDSIDGIAFAWLIYQVTQEAAWSAIIFGVNRLPTIFLQPIAGATIEHKNKKWIMIITDIIRGICVALVATSIICGFVSKWLLLGLTVVISSAEAYRGPASMSLTPQILKKEYYEFGLSLNSSLCSVMELVGFGAAGIIIGNFGVSTAIYIDAATFFLSAVIIMTLRVRSRVTEVAAVKSESQEEKTETIAEDRTETITEAITEDRTETITEDKPETIAEEKTETIAEDKTETIEEDRTETIIKDNVESIAEDGIEILESTDIIEEKQAKPVEKQKTHYIRDFKEGLQYLNGKKLIQYFIVVAVFTNAMIVPMNSLQGPLVSEVLHSDESMLSVLSVALTIGLILGSFIYPYTSKILSKKALIRLSASSVAIYNIVLVIIGRFVQTTFLNYGFVALASAVFGVLIALLSAFVNVEFIKGIEENYLARVGAIFNAVVSAAMPILAFLIGLLANWVSTDVLFIISGILGILITVLICTPKKMKAIESEKNQTEQTVEAV